MWIPIIIPFGTTNKSKVVDNIIRVCPNCHQQAVQLLRNDEWGHLFFVPFFKYKTGTPFLHCSVCGCTVPYVEYPETAPQPVEELNFVPQEESPKKKKKHGIFHRKKEKEELVH